MALTSVYPVLMTTDVAATAAFYRDNLGFKPTFEADWYVSLVRGQWELAILDSSHETIPEGFRGHPAGGIVLNIEVDDVDEEYLRLVTNGPLSAIVPLRSESFGQRHFVIEAPDRVLIDVITPIEPAPEFVAQFA